MPPPAIRYDGAALDLSSRVYHSITVAGSPALSAETIIATLTVSGQVAVQKAIYLQGWAAYTVGTSGSAVTLRLRQTDTAGTVLATTGALSKTAASLYADDVQGVDTGGVLPGQVYVLTMQVTAGAAVSTVSGVLLQAIVI
jgi:hypothetical protein